MVKRKLWPIMLKDNVRATIISLISTLPLLLDLHLLRFNIVLAFIFYAAQKIEITNYKYVPYLRICVFDFFLLCAVEILHIACYKRLYKILRVVVELLRLGLYHVVVLHRNQTYSRILWPLSIFL